MDLVRTGTTGSAARSRHQVLPRPSIAAMTFMAVVAAIVAASLIATSISSSASEGARPFVDTSYDQIERIRGAVAVPAGPVDTSYDQIERIRLAGPGR
jgi:hypothetical protein